MDWFRRVQEYADCYIDVDYQEDYATSFAELMAIVAAKKKENKNHCKLCGVVLSREPHKRIYCGIGYCSPMRYYTFCSRKTVW